MKKAQMEIVGLLIIVLLIIVIFFVFVNISISDAEDAPNIRQEFSDRHVTENFASILIESSTNCTRPSGTYRQVKDLINLCISNPTRLCDNKEDVNVCKSLNQTIEYIANETLLNRGYRYNITIVHQDNYLTIVDNECSSAMSSIRNNAPIPTNAGSATLIARFC